MESQTKFRPNPDLKLMDQVREVLRYHHYAYRTEQTYCQWILRYIRFYGAKFHPRDLNAGHLERMPKKSAVAKRLDSKTRHGRLKALRKKIDD